MSYKGNDPIDELIVPRSKAIKLFKQLGFKTADNWTNKELERKLKNISDLMPGVRRKEFKMPNLFGKICRSELVMVKPDDAIEKESNVAKKKGKKAKKDVTEEVEGKKKKKGKKGKNAKKATAKDTAAKKSPKKDKASKSGKKATKVAKKSKLTLVVEGIMAAKKKASITKMAEKVNAKIVADGGPDNLKATISTTKTCINILSIADAVDCSGFTE